MPAATSAKPADKFKTHYQAMRSKHFSKPFELAYKSLTDLGYNQLPEEEFKNRASEFVQALRDKSWENFLIEEERFSRAVYKSLIDQDAIDSLSNREAIEWFIDENVERFYQLSLSNTQSRRSRAGTEFEAILELILLGAGTRLDSQGALAGGIFETHDLGKAVDLVIPGVTEYSIKKSSVVLVSCKTTLRERWQEVIEEKDRTGAAEVFLATVDEKISATTLKRLNVNNVTIVTFKGLADGKYKDFGNVISFEELIEEMEVRTRHWKQASLPEEARKQRIEHLEAQIHVHKQSGREFVQSKLESALEKLLAQAT